MTVRSRMGFGADEAYIPQSLNVAIQAQLDVVGISEVVSGSVTGIEHRLKRRVDFVHARNAAVTGAHGPFYGSILVG